MNIELIKNEISKTYFITSDGKVINIKKDTEVVFAYTKKGYKKARIWCPIYSKNKDHRVPFFMHRLVAMFYLNDFDLSLQVNHKNGIKDDNRVENLEMVTAKENAIHAWNVLESNKKRRIKVGLIRKGKKHTDEAKKKIGIKNAISQLGRKHTDTTKKKMRNSAYNVWEKRKFK